MIGTLGRTIVALTCAALTAAGSPPQDYQFETSAFMRTRVFNSREKANEVAASGAYGPVNMTWDRTRSGNWFIELQHVGFDAVAAGINFKDAASMDRGLRILEWGLAQQRSDGSFDCPDSFHSASFFVEAAAHSALLLESSPFLEQYRARIEAMKPRIALSARWMTRPDVEAAGKRGNARLVHRRYLVAAAFGETGVLVGDPALVEKSKDYAREGIALQDPSGFNLEAGGYDTSYHGIGMYFAALYYTAVADPAMRAEMAPMLEKGMSWLKSRIRADGSIDGHGNTRSGAYQEKTRDGKPKALDYVDPFRAFAYYAQITADKSWLELADRVAEASRVEKNKYID